MDGLRLNGQGWSGNRALIVLFSFLISTISGTAMAIPANPDPFLEAQGDGTVVVLRARGDEHFSWLEDEDGFTVLRHNGWLHYAELGPDGKLRPGPFLVGFNDPVALGLQHRVLPSAAVRAQSARTAPDSVSGTDIEAVPTTGTLKNLTVLIRFSDHATRALPPQADYDVLFNDDGAENTIAPTGSLKEVYKEMSYNQLTINSTVSDWIQVSNTEAYYANNNGGDSTLWEALREALDVLDATTDFADFDEDNDGYIDSIAFIHSGYGAEWGGVLTRIWSHKWAIQIPPGGWVSNDLNANGVNVKVFNYHISTGLWGTSGTNIGRIGVIAHETGHYLGLPDLYDTDNSPGSGIGHWGLMANSWAFDGQQYCPSHMSAWSKLQLGWVAPTVLTGAGSYTADQVNTNPQIYRIDSGYPAGEYLLLENRQPVGVDCTMPQGGLLIWHIDDTTGYNTEGYPGQAGWPGNGNHYRVALLQADGQYHLEKGLSGGGDAGDVHHGAGVDAIGPGPGGHPNTDTYQSGNIQQTGNTIFDISNSGPSMTFCYNACSNLPAPSNLGATATGTTSISLGWTDNATTEDGFRLEHSSDGSNWSLEATLGANVTAYNDTGLAPGSTHWYRVRAFAGPDNSSWSNTASATTDDVPPNAPTNLVATGVSQSQIDLSWDDNSANETGFRVEVSTDGVSFSTLSNRPANATSYSHTGLPAGTTRFYRVFAVNGVGENVSNTASGTTLEPPPFVDYVAYAESYGSGGVFGTYVDTHADDGVEQQFTEQENGGKPSRRTSYMGHFWRFNIGPGDEVTLFARARRQNNSDGDDFVFAWSADNSTYADLFTVNSATEAGYQGTIPNTVSGEVWIRVLDTDRTQGNRSLDSLWVDHLVIQVANYGPPTEPDAPTNLLASSGGETSIDLSWTDNANNEDGFHVERSPDGSTGWVQVASLAANTQAWSNTGLTHSTTWHYRVRAFNGVGNSAWSNTASATTDAEQPPPADPSNLVATASGSSSIDLTWQDNASNETGFHVARSTDGVNFSIVASTGANAQAYANTGLSPSTQYWYQVRAFSLTKQSGWSNIDDATTDDGPPPPIPLVLDSVNGYKVKGSKNFDLTWSGGSGATVDVYLDGNFQFTTPNDGLHSYDSGIKGGGSHSHHLCETGTANCSNTVVTSF